MGACFRRIAKRVSIPRALQDVGATVDSGPRAYISRTAEEMFCKGTLTLKDYCIPAFCCYSSMMYAAANSLN